jgi:hypothetical protein
MPDNILRVLGVEGKEDVITNLLKFAIESSGTFRQRFLTDICGISGALSTDKCKAKTRISTGDMGIPDLVIWRNGGNNPADLVIIENKLKAEAGNDQLERYENPASVDMLAEMFSKETTRNEHFVFLTLFNDPLPKNSKFVHKRYADLLPILRLLPFNENRIADILLGDLGATLEEFYAYDKVDYEDHLLEKLSGVQVLDAPYLYFSKLFSGYQPPEGLDFDSTFRSSAQGRRYYGAVFYKELWCPRGMREPSEGKWRLDPIEDIFIHFEPQLSLLNQVLSIYVHYEISSDSYHNAEWSQENIEKSDYQAYQLIREFVSLFTAKANIPDYSAGGRSNQIGKALIEINEHMTVAQFLDKFGLFLKRTTREIDNALAHIRGWSFDVRDILKILDEVASQCKRKGYPLESSVDAAEYGFYLKDRNGKNALWVGIWCSYWQKSGQPISLAVNQAGTDWSKESLTVLKSMHPEAEANFDDHTVCFIPVGGADNILAKRVSDAIDAHMNALSK